MSDARPPLFVVRPVIDNDNNSDRAGTQRCDFSDDLTDIAE